MQFFLIELACNLLSIIIILLLLIVLLLIIRLSMTRV